MDTLKMLAELRQERNQLDEAIQVIERLAAGQGRRRGRPPAWMAKAAPEPNGASPRKRKPFSAATRKKMAAAQKKRWAEIRKAG
jgi:hypothetical protein